jgi:hypothetical protein
MLSKVSNFSNKLLCRIGLPKVTKFCRGSWCSTAAFSDDAASVLQFVSSSSNIPVFSMSTEPVGDQLHQSKGSEEKSNGKSIANGS